MSSLRLPSRVGSIRLVVCSALGLMVPEIGQAIPRPGDYDGDGISDVAMASVNRSKKTTSWSVRFANGSKRTYTFGSVPGDALTPGNYSGEAFENPAVVFVRNAKTPLEWFSFRGNARSKKPSRRRFGTPGDTPVQGDYDCDGIMDRAVSSIPRGSSNWKFYLSSNSSTVDVSFGNNGDRVFGADADGDGCSELFAIRLSNGALIWNYRKLSPDTVTQVNWGATGDIPLKPMDMNADGTPDFIVVRNVNGQHVAFVRYSDSASEQIALGPNGTIPFTGRFSGQNNFAWYNRSNRTVTFRYADGSTASAVFGFKKGALIRPDGSVVQNGQDERIGSSGGGGGGGGGGNDDGDGDGDTADINCDETKSVRDGAGNFTHNPDNSRGTIKEMFPSTYTNKISLVRAVKNGQVYDTLYRATPNEWGNRQRYYGTKGSPHSYPKDLTIIATLNSGRNICYKIPNPGQRYD